ncbi:putative amino-acid permease meu22 [Neolecta irregularis DAH-3]|uniref:Putative amino-acid permease meu22 n=1 Tax=Neolecta irregularis (strain DAH-3) TaxID=1198029 RepID=A0A1U7LRC9_NEOID|nr:putative amino-acid permease meu22 [Neolecta irregularis DAH-3]|eukprot:OLL25226.1 putative amino-acid permease meu22 [Neolecta irregularis DAH-3]
MVFASEPARSENYVPVKIDEGSGLQGQLSSRHIQMIAIASAIGTGLFIGTGPVLKNGGPGSLLVAYILIGAAVCLCVLLSCLGEMVVNLPVKGSFTKYAARFIDPALGFALGWQYWFAWTCALPAEMTASAILMQYWTEKVPVAVLITIFLVGVACINFLPVRIYGEAEFISSSIKMISIIGFIILSFVLCAGGGPTHHKHGTEYWRDPGAFKNGFRGIVSALVSAAFAMGGTELVGIAVGESKTPARTMPKAVRAIFFRIVVFYILAIFMVTLLVPSNDRHLNSKGMTNTSPFVIAIRHARIHTLPSIFNAMILICVLSVASSSIYAGSRILVSLSEDGFAPVFLSKTDKQGRPLWALAATTLVGTALSYLNVTDSGTVVFGWFASVTGLAMLLVWATLQLADYELLNTYRVSWYKSKFVFGFGVCLLTVIFQGIVSVWPIPDTDLGPYDNHFRVKTFFANYLGIPVFVIMWATWKVFSRSKIVPVDHIDVTTGRRDFDIIDSEKGRSNWTDFLKRR